MPALAISWTTATESFVNQACGGGSIFELYEAIGVVFSEETRADGCRSCYARERDDDNNPSAYVDGNSGKYKDSKNGREIHIWQLAANVGLHGGKWDEARVHYMEELGIDYPGRGGKGRSRSGSRGKGKSAKVVKPSAGTPAAAQKSPAPRKPLKDWRTEVHPERRTEDKKTEHVDRFIGHFKIKKGGFSRESFTSAGGFYSRWPHGRTRDDGTPYEPFYGVVGVPVYGRSVVELLTVPATVDDSHAVGAIIWRTNALPFEDKRIGKDGKEEISESKMKTIGSADGFIGRDGLQIIADDRARVARGEPSTITRIWKVEGPTDLFALYSLIPASLRSANPILSLAGGSTSVPPWTAEVVRGYEVVVCHDPDAAGDNGAVKTCELWGPAARTIYTIGLREVGETSIVDPATGETVDLTTADLRKRILAKSITFEDLTDALLLAMPYEVTEADKEAAARRDAGNYGSDADQPAEAKPADFDDSLFGNVKYVTGDDLDDDSAEPAMMSEIILDLQSRTDNWPRAIGGSLFVPGDNRDVHWINSTSSLFGWIQGKIGKIQWRRGCNYVAKEEFFSQLSRSAMQYEAVEQLIHVPEMPRHFYTWKPTPGDGSTLRGLLDRFCPSSDIDYDLILSLFASTIWGGNGGTRPIYIITSAAGRGSGKTTLAEMVGEVAGGFMSFGQSEELKDINARLLSEEGLKSRVCFIDNIKSNKFSSSEIEALVTSSRISGRRLFKGEGSRPNTLVWIFTFNGVSLSRDLAQRSIIIKLGKPPRSATWEEETRRYVREKRDAIIGDLVAFYDQERTAIENPSRWASWESAVLSRLPEPTDTQVVISERQIAADVEVDENDSLEDFFAEKLIDLHYDPDNDRIHIPSSVGARWYSEAMNQQRSPTTVTRIVNQMNQENTLKRIRVNPCHTHGRGLLWLGQFADPESSILYSVESRIEELRVEKFRKARRDY